MAAPIDLRNDFDSVSLRRLAKRTRDATQSRRLLALAEVYDGGSRTDASRIGGVGLQIIRDWVLRFNARGLDGLVDGKSPGAPSKLNADHRRALAEVVEAGPVPAVDGVVRWRRKDLARWLLETFAISLDETTVGRELKALGFAKISARPRHYAQNELAVEAFKKNFPAELAKIRARLPKGVEIELWWQDEARIGQKNKLTRRWARRGTRPRAPRDQRTEWAYIFGAICPEAPGFPDQGGLVWMETTKGKPHPVYTHQNQLSRTFKYDLTQGGRFYGHWITQVLSHIRPAKNDSSPLRINGAECYERDYEEFHPRLLYSRLGLNSPLKKALLTEFHSTAKHNATKAVSPSSETMRTI